MPTYPVRHKLPTAYSTEIGKIISRWAYVEWRLKSIVYGLLKINPKIGRVVVRQASAVQAFQMVQELLPLRNIPVAPKDLKAIKRKLERIEEFRNAIAHGIWLKHDKTDLPALQITRSLPLFADLDRGSPTKAKVDPRGLPLEIKRLREVVNEIDDIARFCDWLFGTLSKVMTLVQMREESLNLDG